MVRLSPTARVLAAVLGGLALSAAFPGTDWWWTAVPGVALLVVAVAGTGVRAGLGLGLLHGLAFFLVLLRWTAEFVGPVAHALAVLQAGFVALAGALLVLVLRLGTPPHRVGHGWAASGALRLCLQAAAAGAVWTGTEALRARLPFGGFGWGRLAFSQADAPTLGLAALGGAPLVTFAVATAGAALGLGLLRLALLVGERRAARAHRTSPSSTAPRRTEGSRRVRGRRPAVVVPLVLAAGLVLVGAAVPRPTEAEAGTLVVAGVQGDVAEPGLEFNAERRAVLDNHVQGTLRLAEQVAAGEVPQPDVVVWPENASDIDPFANPDAAAQIRRAAEAVGAPVLVGTLVRGTVGTGLPETGPGDDGLRNVVLEWDPETGPGQAYAKRHPVPFAEYVPYRDVFRTFSSQVDLVRADMVPGTEPGVFDVAGSRLGVLICFEPVEGDLVDDVVRAGAEMLVVPTNNATFGFTDESVQQLAISRVRAVEEGRAVAHISTVGVSTIVAPDGSTGRRTALYTPDVVVGEVPLRTSLTLAARVGQWPELVLSLAGAAAALAGAATTARRRRDRPAPGAGRRHDDAVPPVPAGAGSPR